MRSDGRDISTEGVTLFSQPMRYGVPCDSHYLVLVCVTYLAHWLVAPLLTHNL